MEKLQEQDDAASRHDQVSIDELEAGAKGDGTLWSNLVAAFQSCWRPAIGWVCALALASQYIVRPLVLWGFTLTGHSVPVLPGLDDNLWQLMFGMLGMGTLRTVEKFKGVAGNH